MAVPTFDSLLADWSAALDAIVAADVQRARVLLNERLRHPPSAEAYAEAREQLLEMVARGEEATALMRGLVSHVDDLRAEWEVAHRLTPEGIAELSDKLVAESESDPQAAIQRWVHEIVTMVLAGEGDAAVAVSAAPLALRGGAIAACTKLRELLVSWRDGDLTAGMQLMEDIASGPIAAELELDDPPTQAAAHRIAAWLYVILRSDEAQARRHIDEALSRNRWDGEALAERGALCFRAGDLDRAASDAHRAIEAGATSGYLLLGACAEQQSDPVNADRLYRKGLERLSAFELSALRRRVSLVELTGRALLRVGERLLALDRPDTAAEALDAALELPIADPRLWPAADIHRLRSLALEQAAGGSRRDAALAALESGTQLLWNEDFEGAETQLRRTLDLDDSIPDTGWYLADALVGFSFPVGAAQPIHDRVARAHREFERNRERFGWPAGEMAWAYLTRALIADFESYRPDGDREHAIWQALTYVERGLLHDRADSRFWAFSARYLRWQGLDVLALECIDRARELGTLDKSALGEWAAILAHLGRFDEAEAAARELEAFGEDPWVNGVRAWIALRRDEPAQVLKLLEAPLKCDYAIDWYLDLAADAHLALDDLESARHCFRQILSRGLCVEGDSIKRHLRARTLLGDVDGARRELEKTRADLPNDQFPAIEALMALADADVHRAVHLLCEAIAATANTRNLDDLMLETRLSLRALPSVATEQERVVLSRLEDAVAKQHTKLASKPADPDSELERELAKHQFEAPSGSAALALLAIRARRLLDRRALSGAATDYDRLLETPFAPEARIGLGEALQGLTQQSIAAGDADRVRQLQERLKKLQVVGATDAAIAVARALVQRGALDEARTELSVALDAAPASTQYSQLHEHLGVLALRSRDAAAADRHFRLAQQAVPGDDHASIGRLEAQRCIAASLAGDSEAMLTHLKLSVQAWRDAGAYEPDVPLRHVLTATLEVEGVAKDIPSDAQAAIAEAVKALESAGDVRAYVTETVISSLPAASA